MVYPSVATISPAGATPPPSSPPAADLPFGTPGARPGDADQ
jgi:hypothetical protein